MKLYLEIGKVNFKISIRPHMIFTLILLLLSPAFMGIRNLDAAGSAIVLEKYVALIGIVMLVPTFYPEQDRSICDVVEAKLVHMNKVYIIRLVMSLMVVTGLILSYMLVMKYNNCTFDFPAYFAGILGECILLGGLGPFAYSLTDHIIAGYMAAIIYYMLSLFGSSRSMGILYLFTLTRGNHMNKVLHAMIGLGLLALAIVIKSSRGRR
jgi:hypothetical protein